MNFLIIVLCLPKHAIPIEEWKKYMSVPMCSKTLTDPSTSEPSWLVYLVRFSSLIRVHLCQCGCARSYFITTPLIAMWVVVIIWVGEIYWIISLWFVEILKNFLTFYTIYMSFLILGIDSYQSSVYTQRNYSPLKCYGVIVKPDYIGSDRNWIKHLPTLLWP